MTVESTETSHEDLVIVAEPPMASPASHELSASKAPVPSPEEPIPSIEPKSEYLDPNSDPMPGLEATLEPEPGDVAAAVGVVDAAMGAG